MYSVVADGTPLFTSSDIVLIRAMLRQYQRLYAWSVVRVRRVRA